MVIVGAGAFGLSSAYHLIEDLPGLSVLVVEARSRPGEGSMGASAAMVRDVFSSRDNHLLARNSIAFYRRIMEEHEELRSPQPLLDLHGYLWLLPETELRQYTSIVTESGGSIDARPMSLDEVESCPGLTVAPARWYEGDEAEPPLPIAGGLFGRNCGAVAPEMLANFYFEQARSRGVEFVFDTVVQRLSFEGREKILLHDRSKMPFAFQQQMKGRLRISRVHFGDGRSVRADTVIVAAGGWAEKLLHPLGVATACSSRPQILCSVSGPFVDELLRWEPPVDAIDTDQGRTRFPFLILPTGATLKPVYRERQLWLGCVNTISHPIGAREDPTVDGRLDYSMAEMGDRDAFATDLVPAVSPYLPRFDTNEVRLENSWGGYYNFSPDGLPVVEEESFGVLFVGGDSGSGILKADSLGRLVAAQYEGKTEARFFTGETYRVDRLSLDHRVVQQERIIL